MNKPGRRPKLTVAEQHEVRRYREAGTSIARLSSMWHVTPTTIHKILAAQRLKFGPEQLPENKRHLARWHLFRSAPTDPTST